MLEVSSTLELEDWHCFQATALTCLRSVSFNHSISLQKRDSHVRHPVLTFGIPTLRRFPGTGTHVDGILIFRFLLQDNLAKEKNRIFS
jgi:hypothetical protein